MSKRVYKGFVVSVDQEKPIFQGGKKVEVPQDGRYTKHDIEADKEIAGNGEERDI